MSTFNFLSFANNWTRSALPVAQVIVKCENTQYCGTCGGITVDRWLFSVSCKSLKKIEFIKCNL